MTTVNILVNGRVVSVDAGSPLRYRDVATLANQGSSPSMTLRVPGHPDCIMNPGHSIMPIEGMVFNAYDTSNA